LREVGVDERKNSFRRFYISPEAAPKPDVPADVPVIREGEGVANPATIRNQRKRRDEPRMLGKPVKLERFDRPGRPEADAAGSRRP